MATFKLPLIITTFTEIEIEADNIDEAHDKLIDMGKVAVIEQSRRDPRLHSTNFEVDWESYEAPEDETEDA